MNVRFCIKATISVITVLLLLLALIPQVYATTETRYMRSDNHTVNGLDANILGVSRSDTLETFAEYKYDSSYDVKWGIRVWKRDSGGTETEITSGTPVAQVTRLAADGNVQGLQSATWDCPETALAITDAIVIRVYIKVGTDAWATNSVYGYFITEQLGGTRLDSATWTVYYYTNRWSELVFPKITTYGQYLYGKKTNDTWDSRIDNFQWSVAEEKEWHNIVSWNFDLNTRQLLILTSWVLTLTAKLWQIIASWLFNAITKAWYDLAIWILNLTVSSWHSLAIWSFTLIVRIWQSITSWLINLTTLGWYNITSWNIQLLIKAWQDIGLWFFNLAVLGWKNITSWMLNLVSLGWHGIVYWVFALSKRSLAMVLVMSIVFLTCLFAILVKQKTHKKEEEITIL